MVSSKLTPEHLPANMVFENHTTNRLAQFVAAYFEQQHPLVDSADSLIAHCREMQDLAIKYSTGMSTVDTLRKLDSADKSENVVLVTGTTGILGSYLLQDLVHRADVSRIWALNRVNAADPTVERQRKALQDRGIDDSILTSNKLHMLDGNLSQAQFGLADSVWKEVGSLVI